MNNHAFSIQEIDDAFDYHGQCVLFGSAAVWLYAEYFRVPHVGLTGIGSDIDLLDPYLQDQYSDTLVSENGMRCRHIDLVKIDRVGAKDVDGLDRMSNLLQFDGRTIKILSITALIKAYDTQKSLVMEWLVGESDRQKLNKIESKLKILKDVQAKMSTLPETDGVTYAQFKF